MLYTLLSLFMICFLFGYLVHKVALAKVDKLQQSKKEANHKLRSLWQKIARQNVEPVLPVFDLLEIEWEAIIAEDE